ncbi:MAG: AMP-binding protein [Acidimicrobiia bacterium]
MPATGFFAVADLAPDRPALVDPTERVFTFGELAATANRTARGLRAAGLRPGDTVATMMANSVELLEVYAAAAQIGCCLVVVNWHLTADEVAYILEDSATRLLVVDDPHAAAAEAGAARAGVPTSLRFCRDARAGFRPLAELSEGQADDPLPDRRAGQVMFYTSGTTGRPKGVRKRFDEVPADQIGLTTPIGPFPRAPFDPVGDDVHIVGGPLYHAAPLAGAAIALDAGAVLVLMDRWTPQRWLDLVERYRVTNASMVPTMFHRLLALPDEVRARSDVSSLRSVSHAGAPCAVDLKHRMLDWLGPIITESYSSTEGAGTSVTAQEWLLRPGTVGRPSPGVTLKILDDDGNECASGVEGLVYLSPALWEFEYHHDPAKTDANRRDGLFTVGDIGYVDDDGYLFLCDRQAEVIISGGVNIYPAEVEAALLAHPAVGDAAVIGVPDDEWGEEVRAIVEPRRGAVPGPGLERILVQWCRDRLAHFKCPKRVDFVDTMGRDPNGKLRKAQLRASYWEGRIRRI